MVNIDQAEIDKLGGIIDIPVVADAKAFIAGTLAAEAVRLERKDRTPWLARCATGKPATLSSFRHAPLGAITTYGFSAVLSEKLAEGDIFLAGSSGFASEIVLQPFG